MLSYLGPVLIDFHGDPTFGWTSDPGPAGLRGASIGGLVEWPVAHQLSELLANRDRRVTIAGETGILEYVYAGDEFLRPFNGWYLLRSFSLDGDQPSSVRELVGFSVSATLLGAHRQPVVARSARALETDFDLDAGSTVVQPFWGEDTTGEPFLIDPGGAAGTREYDAQVPHDGSRLTGSSRRLRFHVGVIAGETDSIAAVVLPDLEQEIDCEGASIPRWLSDRGHDVRAYDRRDEREVFGSSHPFVATTDLVMTNGLLRLWVGPRLLPPYVQVQAFAAGEWREVGYVMVADPQGDEVLTSARLERVTPDAASIRLGVSGHGEALLTLRRGERMVRVHHGSSRAPRVGGYRRVQWAGLPPWSRLAAAAQGDGKFGKGIEGGRDDAMWADVLAAWADPGYTWSGGWQNPDFRLRWPKSVNEEAWTLVWWYRPARAAAALNGAGLLTIYDPADVVASRLVLDDVDERFKFTLGATTVQSQVEAFAAGDHVFLGLRFSDDDGMALSVKAGDALLEHVKNVGAAGHALGFEDLFFGVSDAVWGAGNWGDGNWGGVSFADGVFDNLMLFDGYLTDAEVASLAAAVSRLDGLPSPEARLVWHVPGDARPILRRSAASNGRIHEATAELGATRSPDEWGLTKGVAWLRSDVSPVAVGLGAGGSDEELDFAAVLATTGTLDDLVDHHEQFAAASEQEVRVR